MSVQWIVAPRAVRACPGDRAAKVADQGKRNGRIGDPEADPTGPGGKQRADPTRSPQHEGKQTRPVAPGKPPAPLERILAPIGSTVME